MRKKEKRKYIFIDTFAFDQLTKEEYQRFFKWINNNHLKIILSSFQLVEIYNPNHEIGDRITRIINLLLDCDFVIADQQKIMRIEEMSYPQVNKHLPIESTKTSILNRLSMEDQRLILEKLFTGDLENVGIPLKSWLKKYIPLKNRWATDVDLIIQNAKNTNVYNKKESFIESLDMRLCKNIVKIKEKLDNGVSLEKINKKYLIKLI